MRNYIDEHINIDEASFQIIRAYRIRGKNSPRPVIVKFSRYKDRGNVLKTFREKRKNIVNQAPDNSSNEEDVWKIIRVSEDFPECVITVSFLKSSIEEGRNTYLKYDLLMVDV